MSNYLPSNKVKIYPSGFRGTDNKTNLLDPESRLVSEKNLTSGIKALTNKSIRTENSKNSFVISNDPRYSSDFEIFEICIYGYIFKLDLTDFITNGAGKDWTDIWAKIKLSNLEVSGLSNAGEKVTVQTLVGNKVDSTPNNNVLDVQESSEPDSMFMFTGLDLNSKKFNLGSDEYQLHILTRTSLSEASWSIPEESKLLISTDRIAFANTAKSVSDMLTYEISNGLNIIGINKIEPFANGSTIGADQQFESANIGTINTETISASNSGANVTIENIATNKIESTGTNSTIGTNDKYFPTGYISTLHSSDITATNITPTSLLTCSIGTTSNRFKFGYFDTLLSKNLITDQLKLAKNFTEFDILNDIWPDEEGTYEVYALVTYTLPFTSSSMTYKIPFDLLMLDSNNLSQISTATISPSILEGDLWFCAYIGRNQKIVFFECNHKIENNSLKIINHLATPETPSAHGFDIKLFYRKIF